jgi:hypothetical protein
LLKVLSVADDNLMACAFENGEGELSNAEASGNTEESPTEPSMRGNDSAESKKIALIAHWDAHPFHTVANIKHWASVRRNRLRNENRSAAAATPSPHATVDLFGTSQPGASRTPQFSNMITVSGNSGNRTSLSSSPMGDSEGHPAEVLGETPQVAGIHPAATGGNSKMELSQQFRDHYLW